MSSETNTEFTTHSVADPQLGSYDIIDSEPAISETQSNNWWRQATLISGKTFGLKVREELDEVSRLGRRCVLTGESRSVEMAHLIPKSTKPGQILALQYSFGRRLNLNSRWFSLYLRVDWHRSFDNESHRWALVPDSETIRAIAEKMEVEHKNRRARNDTGPWPDYRGSDWFPITKVGRTYRFLPLNLADAEDPCELSRKKRADDEFADIKDYNHYLPPYDDFPALRLHVHPYAVILNAYPKIRDWKRANITSPIPGLSLEDFFYIQFIHDVLYRVDQPSTPSDRQAQRSSGGSGANTETSTPAARKSQRFQPLSEAQGTHRDITYSPSGSAAQDSLNDPFDDLFDGSNSNSEGLSDASDKFSHQSLSVSTYNHSRTPLKSGTPISAFDVSSLAFDKGEIAGWVAGVARACGPDTLLELEVDSSPEMEQYALEPAGPPPTLDWHDRTGVLHGSV